MDSCINLFSQPTPLLGPMNSGLTLSLAGVVVNGPFDYTVTVGWSWRGLDVQTWNYEASADGITWTVFGFWSDVAPYVLRAGSYNTSVNFVRIRGQFLDLSYSEYSQPIDISSAVPAITANALTDANGNILTDDDGKILTP